MAEMDFNECQIVKDSITGKRSIDEQTFASVAILADRLERLKKSEKLFAGVRFSSAVRKLARQRKTVAVC